MTAIENDLAFSRQMAELNAMLAAVTATCRAAEAEAISLRDQLAAERKARDALRVDAEFVRNWVCHNGGLLNEWAACWNPCTGTLTRFIRMKLNAAIDAARKEGK